VNRYPLWKYAILVIALIVGIVYTLPNLFGEAPAVQISSGKVTVKLDASMKQRVEDILAKANLQPDFVQYDGNSVKARLADLDAQRKAKDALSAALNPDPSDPTYIVALNLLSRSPRWLTALHALPMYLGLDLRGGVHFLMQVDMQAALTKKADSTAGDVRTLLRDKNIRHAGITRDGNAIVVRFRDQATLAAARPVLADQLTDFIWTESQDGTDWKLAGSLKPDSIKRVQEAAITQNITTLHNRVNELGVAEPVIQQQGADRVVVQLPGVQDTAKAKDIIGRTATLEMRMVDETSEGRMAMTGAGPVPFGSERYTERGGAPLIVKRQVLLTGENLTDAQPGFDGQTQEPAVHLTVDLQVFFALYLASDDHGFPNHGQARRGHPYRISRGNWFQIVAQSRSGPGTRIFLFTITPHRLAPYGTDIDRPNSSSLNLILIKAASKAFPFTAPRAYSNLSYRCAAAVADTDFQRDL